jgi:hypothetical protein
MGLWDYGIMGLYHGGGAIDDGSTYESSRSIPPWYIVQVFVYR